MKYMLSRKLIPAYLFVFLGALLNLLFIVPSIYRGCIGPKCGLWIGEWQYHDALWHIAVSRISFNSFPFIFPSASGYYLTSYNYFLGLLLNILERVNIDAFFSYFLLLPVTANILFGLSIFRYLKLTGKSISQTLWIIFFTYFGGSATYLLLFYGKKFSEYTMLAGFPVVSVIQPSHVLSNIQFFLSASLFLYIFADVVAGRMTKKVLVTHALIVSLCIGLKIYTSLILLLIIGVGYMWRAVAEKRLRYLPYLFVIGIVSAASYLIFYLPASSSVSSFPFAYYPLSIPHVYTETPHLFFNYDFTVGRFYMEGLGKFSLRLIAYEFVSGLIFVLINIGSKVIFPLYFVKRKPNFEEALLLLTSIVGFTIPILFIQDSGGWYNSIQFAYISIYTLAILAGLAASRICSHLPRYFSVIFAVLIIGISLPNTLFTLKFLTKEKEYFSDQEIKALEYLRNLPNGVVLSSPGGYRSSYVPAFSRKVNYLVDDEQAALLKLPTEIKRKAINDRDCKVLGEVDYIYLKDQIGIEFSQCSVPGKSIKKLYSSPEVDIFKVE